MKKLVPNMPTSPDPPPNTGPPEDELDALLVKVEEKKARKEGVEDQDQPDDVEVFRCQMRQQYIAIFESVRAKYAPKGLLMELDVDEFLGGGASLKIKFVYGDLTMELDGTVMRGGVAFYINRGVGQHKGVVISGHVYPNRASFQGLSPVSRPRAELRRARYTERTSGRICGVA